MASGGKRAAAANCNERASTEESLTSREQRGADLTKKPAKRVKKRRCLAEELENAVRVDNEDRVPKDQHTKLQQAYDRLITKCKQAQKLAAALKEDNARLVRDMRIAKNLAAFEHSTRKVTRLK